MSKQPHSLSHWGWAFLLLAILVSAGLRFWQLGDAPPGLYRDEAHNGLDALEVLDGNHALFFTNNNGREPAYIYLTSLVIASLGQTALAVRVGAAVLGTLTTGIVFLLGREWFNGRIGLLSAWLWAVTLWPIHLSRIGLRTIVLVPCLALALWLGTLAFRRQKLILWLVAGLVYGVSFYTYLAVRFTPLFLVGLLVYLVWQPRYRERLRPGLLYGFIGFAIAILPFGLLVLQEPALFLGRSGQVSILNPAINGGDFWGTLLRHVGSALAMFFVRGDVILRHNPAGRPIFDPIITIPFLIGLYYCLRHWRKPAVFALLTWQIVMLGPTILAEDTPHFLRAVGILPSTLIFPALGLSKIEDWPKLHPVLRQSLTIAFIAISGILTIRDYFGEYTPQPDTAYLFEAGIRDMVDHINNESEPTTIYLDQRYMDSWPSVPFLLSRSVVEFDPAGGLPCPCPNPFTIYAWPYDSLDFVPQAMTPPTRVATRLGELGRNDLEPTPYALYVTYSSQDIVAPEQYSNFANIITLHQTQTALINPSEVQVDLLWSTMTRTWSPTVKVFVHIQNGDQTVAGQSDAYPTQSLWQTEWFEPDLFILDTHRITLSHPYDPSHMSISVGLYDSDTLTRLPLLNEAGEAVGDALFLEEEIVSE